NAQGKDLKNARIFVDLFPCNECAKAIIQCGIKEVIYLYDKYADSKETIASKKMLSSAGVKTTHFVPGVKKIELNFER
ncbi:MAG: deaminase, partial [Treponema porcinum]|nr:deaminase [Treponema porcinum]